MAKLKKISSDIDIVINTSQQGMLLPVLIDLTYITGLSILEILFLLYLSDKKLVGRNVEINGQKFSTLKLYQKDYLEFVGNDTYVVSKKTKLLVTKFKKNLGFKEKYVSKKNLSVNDKIKAFLSE